MVLESLNNLNIKRMVLETPEKPEEVPFDVDRDITEEDWSGIQQQLEKDKNKDGSHFATIAAGMKILRPNFNLNLSQEVWDDMKKSLESYRKDMQNNGMHNFSIQAMEMKILNPSINLNIGEELWDEMKNKIDEWRKSGEPWEWERVGVLATTMKFIDPSINFSFDDKECKEMQSRLGSYRDANHWLDFIQLATRMKIINLGIDLDLNKKAWIGMKQALEENRNKEWDDFVLLAMYMKILTAEEVRVTNNGIELTMPKPKVKPAKDIPPMPETKKF